MVDITDRIAWLAAWSGYHLPTIELITAVMSLGGGIVILLLRRQVSAERWTLYFGWAFMVFGVQYLLQALVSFLAVGDPGWLPPEWLKRLAHGVASPTNNLLFLACANALLGYDYLPGPRGLLSRPWLAVWFRRGPWSLPVARLAWLLALITVVSQLSPDNFSQRLPDALFSAACLLKLGWAMFVNFSPRRQPGLAWLNLFGGGLYGLVNIFYCLNPLLAEGRLWLELAPSLENQLGDLPHKGLSRIQALDGAVFVAAFFLKVFLFLGALLLIMKCLTLLSPRETQDEFGLFREQRNRQLTVVEGMVNALGKSTAANHVAVYFRLPGVAANKISFMFWRPGIDCKRAAHSVPMLAPESVPAQVFMTGKEICTADRERDPTLYYSEGLATGTRALVAVPICYQGAVIGCLHLEWQSPRSFTITAVQRIRYIADLLVPTLVATRQLQALDQLSARLHEVGSRRGAGLEVDSLTLLLQVVQDVLAPTATGLRLTVGFRSMVLVYSDAEGARLLSETGTEAQLESELRRLVGLSEQSEKEAAIRSEKVKIQARQANPIRQADRVLGQLIIAVPAERDPRDRPSMVDDKQHFRTVASLLADTLLELAQRQLNACLLQLQARLSTPDALSPQGWWQALDTAAKAAGLKWLVAEFPTNQAGQEMDLLGGQAELAWVSSARTWSKIKFEDLEFREPPPDKKDGGLQGLLRLQLRSAQVFLWVGLAQPAFQKELELEWSSPWKRFLPRLAEAAGAAWLLRQTRQLETQAASLIQTATKAEASRLWRHEAGSLATKFVLGVEGVERAMRQKWYSAVESRLGDLKQIAERYSGLAAAFNKPIRADAPTESALNEAIILLQTHHESTLKARRILLEIDTVSGMLVAMPLEVTLLALNELVTNAADAIQSDGLIQIQAEETAAEILCHVTNDGPEVASAIRGRLFEPGTTTKPKDGGWGLFTIQSTLQRCRGGIELAYSRARSTRFTIRFPKTSPQSSGLDQ